MNRSQFALFFMGLLVLSSGCTLGEVYGEKCPDWVLVYYDGFPVKPESSSDALNAWQAGYCPENYVCAKDGEAQNICRAQCPNNCVHGCNERGTCQCPPGCTHGCDETGKTCSKASETPAVCQNHLCENGILKRCKADKSGYEEAIECIHGCNADGNDCIEQCTHNVCKDGVIYHCDETNGVLDETGKLCSSGCNESGTACKDECTADVCKDGVIYHCNDGELKTEGEECPGLISGVRGTYANDTSCQQCDENIASISRQCVSAKEYNLCQNGIWSENRTCPEPKYCDVTSGNCIDIEIDNCTNDADGFGQTYKKDNDNLILVKCPFEASCHGTTCGECHNGSFRCENDNMNTGFLSECVDGVYANKTACKVLGGVVSCQSETQCSECRDDSSTCNGSTLITCNNGKKDEIPCTGDCIYGRCVPKCGKGTIDDTLCDGKNNSLYICSAKGEWVLHLACTHGCNIDKNKCYPECRPDEKKCEGSDLYVCDKDGYWLRVYCKKSCNAITFTCN